MTNIVMLVKDRPRLTEQCLRTLYMHTPIDQFNLTVVDDGSWPETQRVVKGYHGYANIETVTIQHSVGVVGFLRNFGVGVAERKFGRGDWLYFSDNDVAFLPGWLERLTDRLTFGETLGLGVLGGYRHPFHGRIGGGTAGEEMAVLLEKEEGIVLTDAVAGYSHLMFWDTWDAYGPFDSHAKGVCKSEDFAFCRKVIEAGGYVGYIEPAVIANCGITNSENKRAVGAESFPRLPGLVYE